MTAPSAACVTLIVAAYNAGATIGRAVRSALAEAATLDVIVVDDASTDDTLAQAQAADDGTGRLRLLKQPQNQGPSAARNRALQVSTGQWIGILDADDFLLPGRLAGMLACANQAGRPVDFIADDLWQVDITQVTGDEIDGPRRSFLGDTLAAPRLVGFAEFVGSNVTRRGHQRAELGFIKPLMRRDFLTSHNLAYRPAMRLGEDYELYARALAAGARLLLIPAQGYVSVIRPDSLSGLHTIDDLQQLRDCDQGLAGLPGLTQADRQALRRHYLSVDCRLQWRRLIEAVKRRDPAAGLRTLLRPYPVPVYLIGQLLQQAALRGTGWRRR